ncbi:MAG TPA: serine hydrolase domain-containing protein, partial [Candidatus Acidoferrales bacterium]|nr:serine hydrolase domain-containing protein [Candidatus Acidoferrales bacterium]
MAHRDFWQSCSRAIKLKAAKFGVAAVIAGALLTLPLSAHYDRAGRAAHAGQQKQTGPAPKLPKPKLPPKNATQAPPPVMEPFGKAAPQLTSQDLGAFFDGMMPLQIQQADIGGAVVAVVKDGQLIFAKGYGYSDPKNKKPVSPDDTLFRVGSISKLFTWTAVMQQVQAGKINLDTDINQYLDFHVNEPHGKITMRNLMTHTPGFEEAIKDLITDNPARMSSLGDYLKTHQPQQIFAPGTTGAYSNYGAGLAGYIVQRVSGESFDDYIEHHIFQPLGMTHASFRQPLPPNLDPLMSQGFQVASGGAKPF